MQLFIKLLSKKKIDILTEPGSKIKSLNDNKNDEKICYYIITKIHAKVSLKNAEQTEKCVKGWHNFDNRG